MLLTPTQQQALKAYILGVPELAAQPMTGDGAYAIATALNLPASPEWKVWRSSVSQDEITQNGFDWTRVDNLNVGEARVWEWMFANESKAFNPSKLNVRAGIEQVWKGTAADLAVRAAVYVHCKRAATVFEKLFSTGTGSDAVPATMLFEGDISYQEVQAAREVN